MEMSDLDQPVFYQHVIEGFGDMLGWEGSRKLVLHWRSVQTLKYDIMEEKGTGTKGTEP